MKVIYTVKITNYYLLFSNTLLELDLDVCRVKFSKEH